MRDGVLVLRNGHEEGAEGPSEGNVVNLEPQTGSDRGAFETLGVLTRPLFLMFVEEVRVQPVIRWAFVFVAPSSGLVLSSPLTMHTALS